MRRMSGGVSSLRTILGNAGALVIAEVVGRCLTFFAIAHLSRRLGPESMGMVELGLGIFGFLSLVALGGVEVLATRRVARRQGDIGRVATTQIAVAWLWTTPAAAMALLLLATFNHPPPTALIAGAIGATALLSPFALRFAFQGREQMDGIALGSLLGQAVWTASVLFFVREPSDVRLVPMLWAAGEFSRVSLMLTLFGRRFGRLKRTRGRAVRAWLTASAAMSIGRVARGLLYFVDVLVLGLFAPLEVVGLYAVGLRIPLFLVSSTTLVNRALFPSFSRVLREESVPGAARLLGMTAPAAISLGLASAITLAVAGEDFLVLLFGAPYAAAAPWFAILLFRAPLAGLSGLLRMVLWVERPRREASGAVLATTVTLVLLVTLTPTLGAGGSAAAMLIGEAVLLVVYLRAAWTWARGTRFDGNWQVLQGVALLSLAVWASWTAGLDSTATMVSAVVVGAVTGFGPLLPGLARLRRSLSGARPESDQSV